MKHLTRSAFGYTAGRDAAFGVLSVEHDVHIGMSALAAMGQQTFHNHSFGPVGAFKASIAFGGVDAADLGSVHLHGSAFSQINDGLRVHYVLAVAVAFAVMFLNIVHAGVFADVEGMNAVVLCFAAAVVVDPAAGHNGDIAILTHIKIIVYSICEICLGHHDGNVAGLALGTGQDMDIDARVAVSAGIDFDVFSAGAGGTAAIFADIQRTYRLANQIGDFFQQLCVHCVQCIDLLVQFAHLMEHSFPRAQPPVVLDRIRGRMVSRSPRWRMQPPAITTISSAKPMMRS